MQTLNPGGTDLVWAAAAEGKVPLGAVQGGVSESGEDLYIGRCKIDGKKLHGKVSVVRVVVNTRLNFYFVPSAFCHRKKSINHIISFEL